MKSLKRDPNAIGFGTYLLRERRTGCLVIAKGSVADYGLDLDDIRDYGGPHTYREIVAQGFYCYQYGWGHGWPHE